MDLGPPKFFWDTLDIFGSHWNDLQAGTLEHPGWPIDTSSPLSMRAHESDLSRSACSGLTVETKMAVAESDRDRVGDREVSLPPS